MNERTPRRYRAALRAYPRRWRVEHREEILSTLAAGDEARGASSSREALALLAHGLRTRVRLVPALQERIVAAAALLVLIASVLPARLWVERLKTTSGGTSIPVLDGPPEIGRMLLAAAAVAVVFALRPRGRWSSAAAGAACFLIQLAIALGVAWSRSAPHAPTLDGAVPLTAALVALGAAFAVDFIGRRPAPQRLPTSASTLLAIAVPSLIAATVLTGSGQRTSPPLMPWQLGPAGLLLVAASALALAALASAFGAPRPAHR